jgi:hypothetical protein
VEDHVRRSPRREGRAKLREPVAALVRRLVLELAFEAVALRISGQFAVAVPVPAASSRKLTIIA